MILRLIAPLCTVLFLSLGLVACSEKPTEIETPVALAAPDDATGYYCGMLLPEHEGPKGQIHLASRGDRPIWFTSVHDTIVFMRLPEEPRDITAVYVHDMGQGNDWDAPEDLWVEAHEAYFVIGSERLGGMGMPEAVPFSSEADARDFITHYGGELTQLADIPDEYFSGLSEEGVHHDMDALMMDH